MTSSYSFKITDLNKQLNESGFVKQIESKILRVIEINNYALIIHTDTLYEMDRYLKKYWAIWYNSPFKDYTDNVINKYIDSWETGKTNKRTNIADEVGVSSELKHLISFYVKNIYLQPVYFHKATQMFPENLDPYKKVYQRFEYLSGNNARDKYIERSQSIYQDFRKLLPNEDKEAIRDIKKILFFTESLIVRLPHYLYNSPILAQFISSIFELKQMYDLVIPNNGLPRMNEYFNNVDISNYKVNYVCFEKDAVIPEISDFTRENIELWYQGAIDTFKLKGNVSKLIESAKLDNKKPIRIDDGWVIFEPKEHSEKKKYFEVQEEFSTLLKIRKQLDKFNLLNTNTHQLSDLKNIEQKINEFWNTLSTPTKELFLSNKNTELFKIIKTFPPQPIKDNNNLSKNDLTIRKKVEKAFAFMQYNDPRKHEFILNETDFDNLINWVTYYFENNFILPEIKQPIQKVNTNKGNVIYTFMSFFKQEHPTKTRPQNLFELIKGCFFEYRNDKIENLKKTSKPQYYDDLISKNK